MKTSSDQLRERTECLPLCTVLRVADKPVSAVRAATIRVKHGWRTYCVMMRSWTLIVISTFGVTQLSSIARAQPFEPISQLKTWYTDRNPVDVEIFATTGEGSEARRLEPARSLRLRLERAYVDTISRIEQPSFSSVSLSFDLPTGLPSALFTAPPEQVELRGDPIRQLLNDEFASRALIILIESNISSDVLPRVSSELNRCKGSKRQDDLFLYDKDRDRSCLARSLGFGTKYVAQLSEDTSLLIQCSDSLIGCKTHFPFDGFLLSVSFHESHLAHWREIVGRATEFLQSKQYR
jgi:hypothetical protein